MFNHAASKGIGFRLGMLASLVLGVGLIAILVGTLLFQADWVCGVIALLTCLVSALLAHVAGEYPKGDALFMARMAMQMAVRSAPPFLIAVWGIYFSDPPFEKSLVFYMILFYLVGLVADVQLSLVRLSENQGSAESS